MHLAELVDLAGELEDALSGGRLPCIHVREDADISIFAQIRHSSTCS
jgi:hypothetical protein